MTKREQLIEKLKKIISEKDWNDSELSFFIAVPLDCDECPVVCNHKRSCRDEIFLWLQAHGDEEVEG